MATPRRLPLLALMLVLLGVPVGMLASRSGPGDAAAHSARLAACETYDCVVAALDAALEDLGPAGALRAYGETNPDSGSGIDCHGAIHELGERAWVEYGVKAWVPYRNVCNYGFYHGVMVGSARTLSLTEFTANAQLLCEKRALPEEVLPGRECAHGFGHAVIHLTDSVSNAVARCNGFEAERFRRRCNEGIAKDLLSEERIVDEEDFDRCETWPVGEQGVCVYIAAAYSVVRAETDALADVSRFCALPIAAPHRSECEKGLGRGVAMKAVGQDQRAPGVWAAAVCALSADCAEGFGRSIFYIRNDLDWSLRECRTLDVALFAVCESGVRFIAEDP